MYAIKWTRKTGESGIYSGLTYQTRPAARRNILALMRIDKATGKADIYSYKIVLIKPRKPAKNRKK